MTTTLVISEAIAGELLKAASERLESGGVLLARRVDTPEGDIRLLGCDMNWVPDKFYSVRKSTQLVIDSGGFVPPLRKAESLGLIPFWVHTHPGLNMSPAPSDLDRIVDRDLANSFRIRSGSDWYGALIFGSNEAGLSFTGHISSDEQTINVDRLWVVGSHYALVNNWFAERGSPDQIFDRSIRAFGGDVQLALAELRVAVVGCGGIGSALIEQLARLGVRHFQLIDKDTLELSNVTRVYGSTPCDAGKGKAELLAKHVLRIAPDAKVEAIQSPITNKSTAKRLMGADIIFGCTDDNAGRLVLSRIASYLMVPVIDSGVQLNVHNGADQIEINGRITALGPGLPCLVCRNRIDMDRAAAETRSEVEQTRLVAEGYAPDLNDPDPAVVAYTTHMASVAVAELLERLVHYGPDKIPSELLIRLHEREISHNSADPTEGHYCHAQSGCIGRGITEPFLGMIWQS